MWGVKYLQKYQPVDRIKNYRESRHGQLTQTGEEGLRKQASLNQNTEDELLDSGVLSSSSMRKNSKTKEERDNRTRKEGQVRRGKGNLF